jgi:hypothetical protein
MASRVGSRCDGSGVRIAGAAPGAGADCPGCGQMVKLTARSRLSVHARPEPYAPPRDLGKYTDIHAFVHMLKRMVAAAGRKMRHADAEDLRELVGIRDELEAAIRDGIDGLRGDGYSWKSIGEALGTTGQAACMRYGKPKAKPKAS